MTAASEALFKEYCKILTQNDSGYNDVARMLEIVPRIEPDFLADLISARTADPDTIEIAISIFEDRRNQNLPVSAKALAVLTEAATEEGYIGEKARETLQTIESVQTRYAALAANWN
jgi:hypothetical protein